MIIRGKCSEFGGKDDIGMAGGEGDLDGLEDTGLSFYEPHEADKRSDLFGAAPSNVRTWKRLRVEQPYIALNIPIGADRHWAQNSRWIVINPKTGANITAWLVDRGPSAEHRVVDLSPGIMTALRLETDDVVVVEEVLDV